MPLTLNLVSLILNSVPLALNQGHGKSPALSLSDLGLRQDLIYLAVSAPVSCRRIDGVSGLRRVGLLNHFPGRGSRQTRIVPTPRRAVWAAEVSHSTCPDNQ